jgi:hypothetical protein
MTNGTLVPVSGPLDVVLCDESTEYYLPVTEAQPVPRQVFLRATPTQFCDFPEKADCGGGNQPGVYEPVRGVHHLHDPVWLRRTHLQQFLCRSRRKR